MSGPSPFKGKKRAAWVGAKISAAARARSLPLEARLAAKLDKSGGPDACWHWLGAKHRDGYGVIWDGVTTQKAHRLALRLSGVEPPDRKATGLVVDHLCRNRACCNPAHMRIVSQRTNTLENSESPHARMARRDRCKYGHPFSGANLLMVPSKLNGGRVGVCRACVACALRKRPGATQINGVPIPGRGK